IVWLTNVRSKNFPNGIRYEACDPEKCHWAIRNSEVNPGEFYFIDVGCGKGRPLVIAAQYPFLKVIGVDYSARLCRVADRNMRVFGISSDRYEIACIDATEFQFPRHHTFAYMYHPFGSLILRNVLDNIMAAASGCRLILAYCGEGKHTIERCSGLNQFKTYRDLALFRNF